MYISIIQYPDMNRADGAEDNLRQQKKAETAKMGSLLKIFYICTSLHNCASLIALNKLINRSSSESHISA